MHLLLHSATRIFISTGMAIFHKTVEKLNLELSKLLKDARRKKLTVAKNSNHEVAFSLFCSPNPGDRTFL